MGARAGRGSTTGGCGEPGDEMTTRDWAHVVLTVVMAYPVVVLLMFVLRALGWGIEPF